MLANLSQRLLNKICLIILFAVFVSVVSVVSASGVTINGSGVSSGIYSPGQNTTILFEDDFSDPNLGNWILFGSPRPRVLSQMEGRDGVFDNNGDSWCDSGAVSRDTFSLPESFIIESGMYLKVIRSTGCWAAATFGLTRENKPAGKDVYCPDVDYPLGIRFSIWYAGDACWQTPIEKRRHAYISCWIYAEDGKEEGRGWILADKYINGWHDYKIVVEDRIVEFYIDEELIFRSTKKLHPSVLDGKKLYLGERSSGSAGKAYHDYVRVYAGTYHDAKIISFILSPKELKPGDTITAKVTVKNTGTTTRSFWVGLSYQKPSGGWYNVPPKETDSLAPGQEQTLQFEYTLPSNAEPGSYKAVTAIWNGYDSENNKMIEPMFDRKDIHDAFVVLKDNAKITSFTPPMGLFKPGDTITARVTVKNTGTSTRSFWVGLSYQKPSGDWYNVPPKETRILSPEEEQTLQFEFILPDDAEPGSYNATAAVWNGYDSENDEMIPPMFDREDVEEAFKVKENWIRIGEVSSPASGIIKIPVHGKTTYAIYILVVIVDENGFKWEDKEMGLCIPPCEFNSELDVTTFHYKNGIHKIRVILLGKSVEECLIEEILKSILPFYSYIDPTYDFYRALHVYGEQCVKLIDEDEIEVKFNNPNPVPQGWEPGTGGFVDKERLFSEDLGIVRDLRNNGYITEERDYIVSVYRDFIGKTEVWLPLIAKPFVLLYEKISDILGKVEILKAIVEDNPQGLAVTIIKGTVEEVILEEIKKYVENSERWHIYLYGGSDHQGNHYVVYVTADYYNYKNIEFININKDDIEIWETRLYHLNKQDEWEYKASSIEIGVDPSGYRHEYGKYITPINFKHTIIKDRNEEYHFVVNKVLPKLSKEAEEAEDYELKDQPLGYMYLNIILPANIKLSNAKIVIERGGNSEELPAVMFFLNESGEFEKCKEIPAGKRGAIKIPIIFEATEHVYFELTGVNVGIDKVIKYGLAYTKDADEVRFATVKVNVLPNVPFEKIQEKDIKILPWSDNKGYAYNIVLSNNLWGKRLYVLFDDRYIGSIPSGFPLPKWKSFQTNTKIRNIILLTDSYDRVFTKELNDKDYNLRNRPLDDFEGEIQDDDIIVKKLADGRYSIKVRNNLLEILYVFIFPKGKETWRNLLKILPAIPPPSEGSIIVDYEPGFIIAETKEGRAWYKVINLQLPNQATPILSFTLHSNADLHIYDSLGRHVGINYTTGEPETQISNATYYRNNVQRITVPAGQYKVVLVGTGSGEYKLTIEGENVTKSFEGRISKGEVHSLNVKAEIKAGNFSIVAEEPKPLHALRTARGNVSFIIDRGYIENMSIVNESDLPEENVYFDFPFSVFSFNITGIDPGSEVIVTINLPSDIPENVEYWVYGPTKGNLDPHWYKTEIGSNDGDNIIIVRLKDGGLGDYNISKNGVITHIGGIIINELPVANANGPYYGIEGQPVEFNASLSYDTEGMQLTYHWNFGDGSTAVTTQIQKQKRIISL